jgi:Na+/H+ antiporter NhaC
MSTRRIFFSVIASVFILYSVRLITVDQNVLIDQAARTASKKISASLVKHHFTMDEQGVAPNITGVSKRTQKRISRAFKRSITTPKAAKTSTPRGTLKSSHFRFQTLGNQMHLKSYHYWEHTPINVKAPTQLASALSQLGITKTSKQMSISLQGDAEQTAAFRQAWMNLPKGTLDKNSLAALSTPLTVNVIAGENGAKVSVGGVLNLSPKPVRLPGSEGLVPPIIALLIAIGFRRIIPALLVAVLAGAAIQQTQQPLWVIWHEISGFIRAILRMMQFNVDAPAGYIGPVLDDAFNLQILGFTFVLVGMIAVVNKMGGTGGLVARLTRLVRGPKSAQAVTALTGTALFFDDYANTVVVGTSGRSITDKFRISREKLAYIVDSTSAPVAGVALLSTWIGYEVGLFDDLLSHLPADAGFPTNGYGLFLAALPYRFYCFFALMLVFVVAFTGRDFGPMLTAERRARSTGVLKNGENVSNSTTESLEKPGVPLRAYNALIPIAVVLVSILLMVLNAAPAHEGAALSLDSLRLAFGNGDLDLAGVLFKSALIGAATCIFLAMVQRLLNIKEVCVAFLGGMSGLWGAACVLILAWAIKQVCDDLGTGSVILALMGDQLPPAFVPVIIFCLSGIIGFSTGTSWGTMALMLPIAAPLSVEISGDTVIVLASLAAVLDGAIWGDHCSPISDTTVLSSAASDCPHLDHVKTQAPYAILAMIAACSAGYLFITFVGVTWMTYPLGLIILVSGMYLLGQSPKPKSTFVSSQD